MTTEATAIADFTAATFAYLDAITAFADWTMIDVPTTRL